jgi:hypothetical protein
LSGTISPNLLVEASINYDANEINIAPSANSFLPSGWSVAPVVSAYTITRKVWPGISGFGNPYGTAEDTATEPYHNAAGDYEPKIDVSYTVGKHATKFGFSYNRYFKNQMLYGDAQGDYGSGALSNDGIMDLLMGIPTSYSQAQSAPIRHYVEQTPSVYAMDNWHVTPRLTLQLGLRYDALPHMWERNNFLGNFDQAAYLYGQAPIFDASGAIDPASPDLYTFNGIPSSLTTSRRCNLASASLKTCSAAARPFSAAASEPSTSACKATTPSASPPTRRSILRSASAAAPPASTSATLERTGAPARRSARHP